jgi:lipid-binding SYLF domain-containing protein
MQIRSLGFVLALSALACLATPVQAAPAREEARLLFASQVLEELRATRDQYIPDRLLERAHAIAVIPDVTKAAFIVGGRRGSGVMVVRDAKGRFSSPVFVSITGGSFGWQAGVQSTDIVLVFTTRESVEGITGGKITLGADASVAAGPVGRQASAATDATFSAEVYSYSRNRGFFAGVSLDGSALTIDRRANRSFYGPRGTLASEITGGVVSADSPGARRFMQSVEASVPAPRPASGTASGSQAPVVTPVAGRENPPAPSGAVRTFPMEDGAPGQEPPR